MIQINVKNEEGRGIHPMYLNDTQFSREIQSVCASMAIEEMYIYEELVNKLTEMAQDEISIEELIQELIEKHGR